MYGKDIVKIIQQYFDVHEKKLEQLFNVDTPMRVIIDKEPEEKETSSPVKDTTDVQKTRKSKEM